MGSLFDLSGKVAVVTGSSRGIGRAIVERMAEHGAKVVISARNAGPCQEAAAAINAKFGEVRALAMAANISAKEQLKRLVDETIRTFGKLDVLVCNAASNPHYGPLHTITDEQFRKILDNNIISNHWLIGLAAPQMIARNDGSIIIISSVGGLKGSPVIGTYCISKAADFQLARNLAVEFGPHNVRINCIAPGLIRTDFARALWENPEALRRSTARTPLGRIGEADEIAGAAILLASQAGSFMTGQTIIVDGGATIGRSRLLGARAPPKENSPMADLEGFRAEARAWLEANCPPDMRLPLEADDDRCWGGREATFKSEGQRLWLQRMAARGWTVPEWPQQYGGGGLSREQGKVLRAEMRNLGCRSPLDSFGIWMLGPALFRYGTTAQKDAYLPPIARGEIRWCQGYSEPNSGSDLASLATRAEDNGDHFLVNGQKIWTSYADKADWIFCLVRTDAAAPKHLGISFILFDMKAPGVSTRPIQLISGKSPFCETFFDNVRVPKQNVVGELNQGWEVAKYLLTHEREMISAVGLPAGRPLGQVAADSLGTAGGILADTCLRADIARFEIDALAFQLALERTGDLLKAKQANPAISSMLKYYGAELNKRRHELLMSVGGSDALEWESERSHHGDAARLWLRTKANSIEGGTNEVQLNVIAKRILQLPGA